MRAGGPAWASVLRRGMLAALSRTGLRFMEKRASMMTAGKADADSAGRCTTLLRADTMPVVSHILIAEDQPAIQELLRWTLQLAGYRATVCADRHAALTWRDKAMPSGNFPAVLLLDLSLLCTNEAADFLRHLRARWQDAGGVLPQIIVLTTSTPVQAELGLRERVLQKPFHVRDLITLIQQALRVASRSEDGL
jgi:CheY-like chemotaxis protein